MLSHQLKQFKIDGEKTIIQNPNEAQRKEHEKCDFALHEVYAIDVIVSTGEGVVSIQSPLEELDGSTSILMLVFYRFDRVVKRTLESQYSRKPTKTIN